MSSLSKFELKLHEALGADIGIIVSVTGDRELARQKFYQARAKNILLFENISIIISPTVPTELWILNKGGNVAETE